VKDPGSLARFRSDLVAWGRVERRSFPWRETSDPFRILVAEVLLQRSRGKTVATVYDELFHRWPDEGALGRARVTSIEAVIRPLGLTKRAVTLKALAHEVADLGAVAFGTRAAVVDGVSARVYRRYFGLDGDGPATNDDALWALVEEVTPHEHVREWNWAVLDLAATVCLPKVPRCPSCPLRDGCAWSRASA
jgi:A/G-specific adenine glycosylase